MANTITKTTLQDGKRNLVVLVEIVGDGSGDETNTAIVTRNAFDPTDGLKLTVRRLSGQLAGFTAKLSFDATTKLDVAALPDGNRFDYRWNKFGGISSPKAGAGYTGNLLISTTGLGSGERGVFTLEMTKN